MLALRQYSIVGSLALLFLLACDRSQPAAPSLEAASTGTAAPTVKAPSNIKAVAPSHDRIDVSWQDNSTNESRFEIHRSASGPSGAFALRASTGANVASYSDAGLNAATQYCYRVRALRTYDGKTSYSDFSNTACATTLPLPTGDLRVTTATTGTDLDSDGYTVSVDGGSLQPIGTSGAVAISGLQSGSHVVALGNVAANCDVSGANPQTVNVTVGATAEVSFAITCVLLTPPAAPSWLRAYGSFGGITLFWSDDSNNEDGFKVERCQEFTCGDADFTLVAIAGANVTMYDDGLFPDGTFYTYRVHATNRAGDSAPVFAAARVCDIAVDFEAPC